MPKKKIEVDAEKITEVREPEKPKEPENITDIKTDNELKNKVEEIKSVLPEIEETKKRGRKKGGTNKPKEIQVSEKLPVFPLSPIFEIIIARLPNPIPLSETEKTLIDENSSAVINKYMTDTKYKEEILLGLVLGTVFYPRLKTNEAKKDT